MARWKRKATATLADMPRHLAAYDYHEPDSIKRERAAWLETHGIPWWRWFTERVVTPRRDRTPMVPARRPRPLTPEELEAMTWDPN